MTQNEQPELTPETHSQNSSPAQPTQEPEAVPSTPAEVENATVSRLSATKVLLILVGILAVVGLTIGGTIFVQNWLNPEPENTSPETESPGMSEEEVRELLINLARRDANDPLSLGEVDAPVVLIAYADYRCPHCRDFANDTLPLIVDEYVNSGDLRIEWRDLPVLGEQSIAAALAAQAAANQGKYWDYHDALIAAGTADPAIVFTPEFFVELATQIGVEDLTRFEEDMMSEATFEKIQADYNEGVGYLGFQSTPTFVVGGTWFSGAQPIEIFRQVIDEELKLVQ